MRLLSERLHETETRLAELSHKEARTPGEPNLEAHRERGSKDLGGLRDSYPLHPDEQLAMMIGSKRVAVSRAFAKLKEEGAVELRVRKIHVANLEALKGAAEA